MTKLSDKRSLISLIHKASIEAGHWLADSRFSLACVESCTGGGIAYAMTEIPGSSAWFDRGFVTYTNLAKQQQVGVDIELLDKYGAVSEQVAAAMAKGGLKNSEATICLSVTGIAGPGGGSIKKPVGTVCFGRAQENSVITTTQIFLGDRKTVRNESILFALTDWLRHDQGGLDNINAFI